MKGDAYRRYPIHGNTVESLTEGFDALCMPESRRSQAMQIVREVLKANGVSVFRWYKTERTNELACYWDDADVNKLWITPTEVHVECRTPRPERALTWDKEGGKYVGWLLPGAERGTGGGARTVEMPTVLCPETFLRQPAGSICPTCEVSHG
jgi:hypothetical protein